MLAMLAMLIMLAMLMMLTMLTTALFSLINSVVNGHDQMQFVVCLRRGVFTNRISSYRGDGPMISLQRSATCGIRTSQPPSIPKKVILSLKETPHGRGPPCTQHDTVSLLQVQAEQV